MQSHEIEIAKTPHMHGEKKKRLLMISIDRSLFKEGTDVRIRQIEYAQKWDEVHIIVVSSRHATEQSIAPNCWVYPTRSFFKIFYPLDLIRLGRFIISRRGITDITCQDPFFTALAGVSLKKQFDLPLELQVHTDIGSPYYTYRFSNKVRKALALSYLPKADHIRVVSERIRKYLIEKLKIEDSKIEVRPIHVDVEKIKEASIMKPLHGKYPQFNKIILMASRFEKEKNIGLAIDAFAEVVKKFPKTGLIIVGSGSLVSSLQSQISRLNLSNSVIIEPWISRYVLYSYYKTADLFLNTSMYEGYGMALVEAHAAGCQIVSTDVGVAPELSNSYICPVNDRECIQQKISIIISQ